MAWFLIVVAGLFETGFAVLLKQSETFTRLWPTVRFAVCALISFGFLTMGLRGLEIGPAYAVWTGLGTAAHPPPERPNTRQRILTASTPP